MKVQVLEWDVVRGRTDVKNPRWFGFQKKLFNEPQFIQKLNPFNVAAYAYICSMALDSQVGECSIVEAHMTIFTQMTPAQFWKSVEELEQLQLVRNLFVIRTEPVQVADEAGEVPPRDPCAALHSIAEHSIAENPTASRTDAPRQTTYVPLEEELPRKKREKKPKMELPCDAIEELKSCEEILLQRKIPTILQEKWVKLYDARFVARCLLKGEEWLIRKDVTKKNYGQFFGGWMDREHKSGGSPFRSSFETRPSNELPKQEVRKKTYWEEEQDRLDAERARREQ